jgi:hypothetical protein
LRYFLAFSELLFQIAVLRIVLIVFEVVLLLLPPMLVLAIPVGGVEVVVAVVHVVVAILEEVVILGVVSLSVLIPWTVLGSTWQTQRFANQVSSQNDSPATFDPPVSSSLALYCDLISISRDEYA